MQPGKVRARKKRDRHRGVRSALENHLALEVSHDDIGSTPDLHIDASLRGFCRRIEIVPNLSAASDVLNSAPFFPGAAVNCLHRTLMIANQPVCGHEATRYLHLRDPRPRLQALIADS